MKANTMSAIGLQKKSRRRRNSRKQSDSPLSLTPMAGLADSSPGTSIYEVMAHRLMQYTNAGVVGDFPSFLETLYFDSVISDGSDRANVDKPMCASVNSIEKMASARRSRSQ